VLLYCYGHQRVVEWIRKNRIKTFYDAKDPMYQELISALIYMF